MTPALPPQPLKVVPLRQVSLPQLIAKEKKRRTRSWLVAVAVLVVLAAAIVTVVLLTRPRPALMSQRFRTATVTQGAITREVLATGHVEAVSTVAVGAEISGRIATVEVDFNDHVKLGQVMARFDQKALEAQQAQAIAMASASRAQVAQARADLAQARRTRARADELFTQGAQTQIERENAVTAVTLAVGRVSAAQATLAAQQAQASLVTTNLKHAIIYAPIDGMVITRNIDPGQTVASMLQTPVLFTVAADLRKMEVVAAVDEADIGSVKEGQPATFTVTAWPTRTYQGVVSEVRNSASVIQDVVTYGAVVSVENPDLTLKPGMTASVRVRTGRVEDSARLPNAALQFTPPNQTPAASPGAWVLTGEAIARVPVHPGLSDGELTAIAPLDVSADAKVLVDLTPEGKKAYAVAKPR